ncbi:MAG: hypothetical protein QF464_21150, partial [Myxococcota bacterium]|nr:hypothetical protein [Myxococcota bacterium]
PEPARLVVSNDSSEAIAIRIDGRPYGRVEAESRSGFDGLVPGRRAVDVLGLRSGWHRSLTLTLRSGSSELVELTAPMAVLVVDNQSGEVIKVGVAGQTGVSVESAKAVPLNVPAGRRKLTAVGQDTGQIQVFEVALAVGQSHHLLVARARARLVVVNRTARTATVRLADRVLGQVEAGGTGIYEDLPATDWWLTAHDPDLNLTHSEHREVTPGETRSWILTDATTTEGGAEDPESTD